MLTVVGGQLLSVDRGGKQTPQQAGSRFRTLSLCGRRSVTSPAVVAVRLLGMDKIGEVISTLTLCGGRA